MIKKKKITISYMEAENQSGLDEETKEMIEAARNSALNAYAPYSRFRVGAAVKLESGRIVCGTNVENAAFPSGICAERNALSYAVSNYSDDKPVAIAIAAMTDEGLTEEPVTPCGNCRQVIAEEESRNGKNIKIILSGKDKTLITGSVADLLPLQFRKNNLKINLP
ncbi:MAG TPA: cytidine deaminase [Bacteroidales bacterium]|nr:cytidine deaminase [Bacteroidales bacterium]